MESIEINPFSFPPEIDNSQLIDDDGEVRKSVFVNLDFKIFSKEIWNLFHSWYGC